MANTIKNEDLQKYVSLIKDAVQLGLNLSPDDSVPKKALMIVNKLLEDNYCLVDAGVFVYNVVVNFNNKDEFTKLIGPTVPEPK